VASLRAESLAIPELETAAEELRAALEAALAAAATSAQRRVRQEQCQAPHWRAPPVQRGGPCRSPKPSPAGPQPTAPGGPSGARTDSECSPATPPQPPRPPSRSCAAAAAVEATPWGPGGAGAEALLQASVATVRVRLEALERELRSERESTEALARVAADAARAAAQLPRPATSPPCGGGDCRGQGGSAPGSCAWQPQVHIHNSMEGSGSGLQSAPAPVRQAEVKGAGRVGTAGEDDSGVSAVWGPHGATNWRGSYVVHVAAPAVWPHRDKAGAAPLIC
jgi:hypothetical protein